MPGKVSRASSSMARLGQLATAGPVDMNEFLLCGNFDIIPDHLSRTPQLYTTLRTPCAMIHFVPRLVG